MLEHTSSPSGADCAARDEFFEILLSQDGAPLPLAAADSLLKSCVVWYAKFLECRFKGAWTSTTREALKGLWDLSNEPRPNEIGVVYRFMAVVAKGFLESGQGLAMIDIADELGNQGLLKDQKMGIVQSQIN
jgi:hypothetical protein